MVKVRAMVQGLFTLATNGYLIGFVNGRIYQGATKQACVPGLSCYSCPGALGSCPVGALQAVANDRHLSVPFYAAGFLTVVGAALGRFACGWLCPFGWFQELLYRIPLPYKGRRIPGDRMLRTLKYWMLAVFVLLLPMAVSNSLGYGDPWFCKYVCPSGTLMAGWPLAIANEGVRSATGILFGWKSLLLTALILASLWVYRPFCKWLCPLGAIYGFFNRLALYRFSVDEGRCTGCASCVSACKMGISPYRTPNSMECIRCGDCLKACPTGALRNSLPTGIPRPDGGKVITSTGKNSQGGQ